MLPISSLRRRLLSASALPSVFFFAAIGAHAAGLPTHGHYVSGQGSINKASQSVTVRQSSTTGIIDWKGFSVGKDNTVRFDNGSGATLNRVTGGNLSTIAGSLHATGSLYLINSQGVIVSGTGRVVTGGNFVASSAGTPANAFDDGKRRFSGARAAVVNRGSIIAGGSARLIGTVVTESGTVRAESVNLRAREGLVLSGSVVARHTNGIGGTIVATGRTIDVTGTARISASGTQAGKVFIGGDIHGGAIAAQDLTHKAIRNARSTIISQGARISADASHGAGGDIVIWSDGHTTFAGNLSATGQTGGGFAEVSSEKLLGFTGRVDLLAKRGQTGTLLLDPENVVISSGTTDGSISGGTYTPPGPDSVLNVGDLQAALANADVVVNTHGSDAQAGEIAVLAPLTWSDHTLTLDADGSIYIEAHVTAQGGSAGLTMIDADTSETGVNDGNAADGDIYFDGGRISFVGYASGATDLSINGHAYTLENNISDLAAAISGGASGYYALADNYDASVDGTYSASPIPTTFTGTFEGLGNTVSNLSINDSTASDNVGLFA